VVLKARATLANSAASTYLGQAALSKLVESTHNDLKIDTNVPLLGKIDDVNRNSWGCAHFKALCGTHIQLMGGGLKQAYPEFTGDSHGYLL